MLLTSVPKIEAVSYSEMLVPRYQTARCHDPEEHYTYVCVELTVYKYEYFRNSGLCLISMTRAKNKHISVTLISDSG
jgi:hypothetical protein